MKITSIVVDGVGKFGTRAEITGLGPGVNVLAAGNEAGKSTLFRAVRACLFERHNTRNEIVRNLATDGLSLPITVTLAFEHAEQAYTVRKSFVKGPAASLMRGGVEIARHREADEMLWELLGIAPGSGRSVDESAFGILWVGQGQSFTAPEPTEAATTVLNSAIQAEVGSLVGGERARAVLATLREELAQLVTETGRPKTGRPFAEAIERLEVLQQDLAASQTRLSVLDNQLVELESKRSERTRLGDPALLRDMTDKLAAARESEKEGAATAALLAQFEAAERSSKAALDRAEDKRTGLEDRQARIDSDRQRDAALREALLPIAAQEQTAREEIRMARDRVIAFDSAAERDEERERNLHQLGEIVVRAMDREALVHRRLGLIELGERIARNTAVLASNRVTASILKSLDDVEREIAVVIARLEAVAPEVAVALGLAGAGKVSIGDAIIAGNAVHAAVDPVTIRIGDLATVTVTPKAASAIEQKKRQDAQRRLAKLIEEAGVGSAGDLRVARARRETAETETVGLRAELKMLGISGASPALAIESLDADIRAIDALVAEALAKLQVDVLPSAEEIAGQQNAVRMNREEARRQRQMLGGTIDAQSAILATLADSRGRLGGTLTEIQNRLKADLAVLPDADRLSILAGAEKAVADAGDDYRIKAVALEEQRQKAPSTDELEQRKTRVMRLAAALDNKRTHLTTLDRAIANLEGQIQNAGGDGLGEKVEELQQARDLTEREVEKYRGRVETLLLLKTTIETCYTEQRDRLHAPLRRHLKPFLNDVFPSADLELGEGFSIAGIRRNGPAAESFDRLSAGTQEQIAVLVRLAMGAMICDRGHPVPIVLDDALVFSDDDRIEQMFDALNRAGQKQQVIVLTCRTRAFALLGGRQLSISTVPAAPG